MATRNKERAPTPATLGNDPELDPGAAEPTDSDSSAVDSLLDSVLGGPDEGADSKPPAATPPAASDKTPAGDPPPAKDPVAGDPAAGKPPTGPRAGAPAEAPAPAAEVKPDPNAPPHDAEIDGIKQPDGLNPANQQNFKNLREVARKYKGLANQHYDEAEAFKKQVGQIPPEIQKELEENRSFRRMFDITNDREFKDKFDKPSGEAQEEILSLLKENGGTEDQLKTLKAAGVTSKPDSWWEEFVLKPLRESNDPKENTAGVIIKQRLEKMRTLQYDRQREVEKASGSQSEFLKNKEETARAVETEDLKTMQTRVEEVQAQIPWAKQQEIPKDATPEQRNQIEAQNKFYRETIEPAFVTALFPKTALARVESALAVCLSFKQHQDINELKEMLKLRDGEISRLKGANIIKPSATAVVNAPKSATGFDPKVRSEDAIEAAMKESGL